MHVKVNLLFCRGSQCRSWGIRQWPMAPGFASSRLDCGGCCCGARATRSHSHVADARHCALRSRARHSLGAGNHGCPDATREHAPSGGVWNLSPTRLLRPWVHFVGLSLDVRWTDVCPIWCKAPQDGMSGQEETPW